MSRIHYYDLLIVVGCILLYFIIVWGWDKLFPALDHDFDKAQDWDFSTDRDCYEDIHNTEVSDPYLRIDNLEHEIRGYLAQIDTLHEIIYSLRHFPAAKHPNEGGGVRVEGPSHPASNSGNSCDCA